jgi:hypothetical protein
MIKILEQGEVQASEVSSRQGVTDSSLCLLTIYWEQSAERQGTKNVTKGPMVAH